MLSPELLSKVKQIEITTRRVVTDVMSGQYRSHFKGHGVQFSEHRLYVAGDDVRHIDWKVSARSRDPVLKKYEEERELTVLLVVDISGSEAFGSHEKLKSEIAAEIGGMLAYAAVQTGDKVGLLLFAGAVEKVIPPKKGRAHIQRIISEILTAKPKIQGTDLSGALESAARLMKHTGVVFSDFIAENYEVAIKRLARKNDVVAVQIGDARENLIPEVGQILLYDEESSSETLVDTSSYAFKKWFKEFHAKNSARKEEAFKKSKIESLKVSTEQDYSAAVVKFFRARARRRRS